MKCSTCGAELKPDAKVCDFCGTPVTADAAAPAAPAPEEFIPPAFPYADDPLKQAEPAPAEPAPVEPETIDYTPKDAEPAPDFFPEPPAVITPPAAANDRSGFAIASLVIGVINMCSWIIPFCGVIFVIIGLILGFMGLKSRQRNLAIGGIVLNFICLCAALAFLLFFLFSGMLASLPGLFPNQ
jgi:hypothetical protein